MRKGKVISVVIPALNEESSIAKVIGAVPSWVDEVVVVDNGSTDSTVATARAAGAKVVHESRRGYGSACLRGVANLRDPDVVVFLDGDFSDDPTEMDALVDPVAEGRADMVIGSRTRGEREAGALTPQAIFGNWLSCTLIRLLWRVRFTDLGPFRAIRRRSLEALDMVDPDFGWTVEMQIKASRAGMKIMEVPVAYRRRIGVSKISGTLKGVLGAGWKILSTIFVSWLSRPLASPASLLVRRRCIVFTRFPRPGETKTRLIPALGPEGAALVHKRLSEDTVRRARGLAEGRRAGLEIRYEGGDPLKLGAWLGGDLWFRPQARGDLGDRMDRAFADAFAEGAEKVVIIGTDCPDLSEAMIEEALEALEGADLVLGPARDGGYTLIALGRRRPDLFEGIPWGGSAVLEETLKAAERTGLQVRLLKELDDVDRPEDLHLLPWKIPVRARGIPKISVIIPTLNEEDALAGTLEVLRWEEIPEVVVVDGGSSDKTALLARAFGAKVLHAGPYRASQLNVGAEAASGDVLVFLHADTRLPSGFRDRVISIMMRSGAVAGAFQLRIDAPFIGCRLVELLVSLRTRLFSLPYGDQALFMKAEDFRAAGGFPSLPIMEDFLFARRLRRLGRIVETDEFVVTSGRRWERVGVLKTTWMNQIMILAFAAGVSPARLARWYRSY
ncbi:MAG: TIGR04283 family arsenosugar biosynthesis glycosyltransferase [Planctomycetota bacterium]|jgi:rSAM/selenodomain-associated transferase 2/rSAM/selenodomain-associated transferase 1